MVGSPAELNVVVRLPEGYDESERCYPTVYFLTGWDEPATQWDMIFLPSYLAMPDDLIVVIVDGQNPLGGSFYRNSPVTGNWEDAIADDLVAYVDSAYRTIPTAASRGVGGYSMGGYGALNLALDHPDLFGAVGILSPGVVSDEGMVTTQMFDSEETIRDVLAVLGGLDPDSASADEDFVHAVRLASADTRFALSYGAAIAPDPSSAMRMQIPYQLDGDTLVEDPEIMATWNDGFGNWDAKVAEHGDSLAALAGLQIEYGSQDPYGWIIDGCRYLDTVLTEADVPHTTIEFDGNHRDQVSDRMSTSVLPFFDEVLEK